jgi:ankyrin repeat protein
MVSLLLRAGADPMHRDAKGFTPLHFAAGRGMVDIVGALLPHCELDAAAANGQTPLSIAALEGHGEVARLLLEAGANPNAQDARGFTPAMTITAKSAPALREFIRVGADFSIRSLDGHTALHMAAWRGDVEVMRLLLGVSGMDVDARTTAGWTPLAEAVNAGQVEVARFLIAAGADLTAIAHDGANLLYIACAAKRGPGTVESVDLLLQAGVNPRQARADGATGLHVAAHQGNTPVVALLIGVSDLNARSAGVTPLEVAIACRHVEVAKLLRDAAAASR